MHDSRYLRGIEFFNKHEFYDAHELWENLWHEEHGEAKNFIRGLIQYATALHHFEARNLKGTRLLYEMGTELLKPYGTVFWNLPVHKLITDMTQCVKGILEFQQDQLPGRYDPKKEDFPVKIDEELIPKIKLV
jgi:predicted metal-dependent hydrolase